jgi:carbonic anhydrase
MTNAVMSAGDALARLKEGNHRFASNVRSVDSLLSQLRRADLASRQAPFAIILGCSDSRAPAEIVFDQGLGDLFVIRVAGNIVAPSQVGSVEFAATRFRTRLVVVMGHTGCGAIDAAIEASQAHLDYSKNQLSIVARVRPWVAGGLGSVVANDRDALARAAVRANVSASANHLRHGSPVLEDLIANDGLLVVGALYDIESGVIDFFDGDPVADA